VTLVLGLVTLNLEAVDASILAVCVSSSSVKRVFSKSGLIVRPHAKMSDKLLWSPWPWIPSPWPWTQSLGPWTQVFVLDLGTQVLGIVTSVLGLGSKSLALGKPKSLALDPIPWPLDPSVCLCLGPKSLAL